MADPEVWQALLNTGNPYYQQSQRNKGLAEMLAIEKAQRGLRQEEQLQELFSRSQKPTVSEVGAVMPSYVPDYVRSQYEGQKQQQELNQAEREYNASIFGSIAERAMIARDAGDPQWQQKFNVDMGKAASDIVQSGGRLPNNFNPEQSDPWTVLTNSVGFKYKSPYLENMMALHRERETSKIAPRMTPGQFYGEYRQTPEGYNIPTPAMGGQALQGGRPQPTQPPPSRQQPYEMNKEDVQSYLNSLPEGAEKESIIKAIESQKQVDSETAGVDITPEQLRRIREFSEVQKERKVTRAREEEKAAVQHEEENKRITEAFSRAMGKGGVSRVMNLISQSTSGPTESLGAELYSRLPQTGGSKSTKGMEAIGSLGPIAKEIKKTIERSPGPQSDKDVAIDALAAAAIDDPNIPSNQRMKGFLEFVRIIKERADALGIDPKAIGIDVNSDTGSSIPTAKTDAETGVGPVKVKTKEEAEKLSPGTLFETPDGKIMRRH